MGILKASLAIGALTGSFFSGFLIDALGFHTGFLIAAMVMVPALIIAYIWDPEEKSAGGEI